MAKKYNINYLPPGYAIEGGKVVKVKESSYKGIQSYDPDNEPPMTHIELMLAIALMKAQKPPPNESTKVGKGKYARQLRKIKRQAMMIWKVNTGNTETGKPMWKSYHKWKRAQKKLKGIPGTQENLLANTTDTVNKFTVGGVKGDPKQKTIVLAPNVVLSKKIPGTNNPVGDWGDRGPGDPLQGVIISLGTKPTVNDPVSGPINGSRPNLADDVKGAPTTLALTKVLTGPSSLYSKTIGTVDFGLGHGLAIGPKNSWGDGPPPWDPPEPSPGDPLQGIIISLGTDPGDDNGEEVDVIGTDGDDSMSKEQEDLAKKLDDAGGDSSRQLAGSGDTFIDLDEDTSKLSRQYKKDLKACTANYDEFGSPSVSDCMDTLGWQSILTVNPDTGIKEPISGDASGDPTDADDISKFWHFRFNKCIKAADAATAANDDYGSQAWSDRYNACAAFTLQAQPSKD